MLKIILFLNLTRNFFMNKIFFQLFLEVRILWLKNFGKFLLMLGLLVPISINLEIFGQKSEKNSIRVLARLWNLSPCKIRTGPEFIGSKIGQILQIFFLDIFQ